MDFNDPKEFDDILVSPDPKGISIGSKDFDNPKVNVDKFILDGLVYVARLGSASLKIVQITRRGTRKILKSLYYTIELSEIGAEGQNVQKSKLVTSFLL